MNKLNIIILFINIFLMAGCSNTLDLANISFDEDFDNYASFVKVKEKREIDLRSDFNFARIEPMGYVEQNNEVTIYSYFISPEESQVVFGDVNLGDDLIEIRTVDNKVIGYRCATRQTSESITLLSLIRDKYGNGKLIHDYQGTQYYIWSNGDMIIEFNSFISPSSEMENQEGQLIVLKKSALANGQWPIYMPYLEKINMPDIRK